MSNSRENTLPPELSGEKEEVKGETENTDSHMLPLVNKNSPHFASASSPATQPLLKHDEPTIIIWNPDVENLIIPSFLSFSSTFSCDLYDRNVTLAAQMFGLGIQNRLNNSFEEEESKRLDELPDKLVKRIVDYLNLLDKMKFRRVCKKFHALTSISYGSIELSCDEGRASIMINGRRLFYMKKLKPSELETVENANMKNAIEALKSMLILPNLTLEHLNIRLQEKKRRNWAANLLLDSLKLQDASLSVTTLALEGFKMKQVYQFLQYFSPGILKNIMIKIERKIEGAELRETLGKLFALEQWKQALEISLSDINGGQTV